MSQFEIREAESNLRALIDRASAGEEVVLVEAGRTVARLLPVLTQPLGRSRVLGRLAGQLAIPADFDAPLPDNIIDLFYDGSGPGGDDGDIPSKMRGPDKA